MWIIFELNLISQVRVCTGNATSPKLTDKFMSKALVYCQALGAGDHNFTAHTQRMHTHTPPHKLHQTVVDVLFSQKHISNSSCMNNGLLTLKCSWIWRCGCKTPICDSQDYEANYSDLISPTRSLLGFIQLALFYWPSLTPPHPHPHTHFKARWSTSCLCLSILPSLSGIVFDLWPEHRSLCSFLEC